LRAALGGVVRPGRRNGAIDRTKKRPEEESEESALDGTDRITWRDFGWDVFFRIRMD
jgi:hypothetical protein